MSSWVRGLFLSDPDIAIPGNSDDSVWGSRLLATVPGERMTGIEPISLSGADSDCGFLAISIELLFGEKGNKMLYTKLTIVIVLCA